MNVQRGCRTFWELHPNIRVRKKINWHFLHPNFRLSLLDIIVQLWFFRLEFQIFRFGRRLSFQFVDFFDSQI